jgi:hypothetical protein
MRSCYVTPIHQDKGIFFVELYTQLEKALGFERGSEVYFSWLDKKTTIGERGITQPELIVTSISPDCWDTLYDLEFHLGDEIGSLASAAQILGENGINILISQSRTTLRGGKAEWTTSADFSEFNGGPVKFKNILKREIEENHDRKKREYLKKRILKYTDKREKISKDYVRVKKSEFAKILNELKKQRRVIPFKERPTLILQRTVEGSEVATLEIPSSVMQMLSEVFDTAPQNIDTVVMIADTEQTMLSLWFPHPTEKIVKLFIEIGYEPGSLAEIASFLADKGINFLETDTNLLIYGDKGMWKIVADINGVEGQPCMYADCKSTDELEERLTEDFRMAGIKAFKGIHNVKKVGEWAKKPNLNPPQKRDISIGRGQGEEAEKFLRGFLNCFRTEVKAILPYMDKTTFDYLDHIPRCCGMKVITSLIKEREKCLEKADELAYDRPSLSILELALKSGEDEYRPLEHMRWICDQNLLIALDTDLKKSALNSRDYSIEVKDVCECSQRLARFNKRWSQSKSDLEQEFEMLVIRKFLYPSSRTADSALLEKSKDLQ